MHTVAEIVHRKGRLSRTKEGRACRYRVTPSREAYAASLIDQVWVSGADRTSRPVRLFDETDADEVAELRTAFAACAEEAGRDGGGAVPRLRRRPRDARSRVAGPGRVAVQLATPGG